MLSTVTKGVREIQKRLRNTFDGRQLPW
jgi:hypothetical protein